MTLQRHPKAQSVTAEANTAGDLVSKFKRLAAQADAPATDVQLATLWPAWHALPENMSPERRRYILTRQIPKSGPDRGHYRTLRHRFKFLPLGARVYKQALDAAVVWSRLIRSKRSTFEFHKSAVEAQLTFSNFDDLDLGRIAVYRTAKELDLTQPGLLAKSDPTPAEIGHFRSRYNAYLRARSDAIELLFPIVFLPRWKSRPDLPFEEQAFGVPNPDDNFPRHIYIARLAAFGTCSSQRLAEFFAESFLKLSPQQKREFCQEYDRPAMGRQRYNDPFLPAWLADNAPLFAAFKCKWQAILDAARHCFIEGTRNGTKPTAPEDCRTCPTSADSLKVIWKDIENTFWQGQPRRISPPTGRPPDTQLTTLPVHLLTPLPSFRLPNRKG